MLRVQRMLGRFSRHCRQSTVTVPTDRLGDVPTGVIFFDKSDKRVLAPYFEKFGKNGLVNREPVTLDDNVYRWRKAMMRGFAD